MSFLEAFNHGMPAVSYDCKGPRDIIEQGKSGYLIETKKQFAQAIITHFTVNKPVADEEGSD